MYSLCPSKLDEVEKIQEHSNSPFIGVDTIGMESETLVVRLQYIPPHVIYAQFTANLHIPQTYFLIHFMMYK